jgi:xylulokinase
MPAKNESFTSAILGVDIGTSSTKGVLVALDGAILASTTRTHSVDRPHPGHVEMDPVIWWDEFVSIAEELGEQAAIIAVGVSGMGPCVLLTDRFDKPVRRAILYGVDTRAQQQIQELGARIGRERILERCGSALTSQAVGPKLAWIREHEPDSWARAQRLFMPSSYLVHKLTGAYVLDQHSASQSTPLYDAKSQAWIADWAEEIAPGIELPELVWPGDVVGEVGAQVPGLLTGIPVIAGTIDAWAESISVGATGVGDLMLMYGTTMFLIATVAKPVTDPSMWGTTGAYPGVHNLAGGLATSGAITDWIRDLVDGVAFETLISEASASPHGAKGLLLLPYFAGERTPIQDPNARGAIAGLTLEHTRGDLYRAALEGTAFAVRHNIESMRAAGVDIRRVVAVGGGTQGNLWTQIVSDITGLEQVIPTQTIGASLGAAMLAAPAVGVDIAGWNPPARVVAPAVSATNHYDRIFPLYRDLYTKTADLVHELVAIAGN